MNATPADPMVPPLVRERGPALEDIFHAKLHEMYICGDPQCHSVSNVAERCPSCHSQNTKLAGLVENEATELAHEIALDDSKIVIDSFAVGVTEMSGAGETRWHDVGFSTLPRSEAYDVHRAVQYLELRGLLIRHPERGSWVRW
jgi:hypothetical protein